MGLFSFKTAQGTIEYLVIMAIVVVIALIVVGLFTGMFSNSSQQINASSNKIGAVIGSPISVSEAISDSNGDSLIKINNNSGDNFTLKKIVVGGEENSFDEQIVNGDSKSFSLVNSDLTCPCLDNQKSATCSIEFYYISVSGIEKKETRSITVECVNDTQPVNPSHIVGLGDGTIANPWIVNSCLELQDMNQHLDGNYALGGDINCSDTITWNNGSGFKPIGNATYYFSGTFDGRNHTISNLYINRYDSTNTATTATLPSNYIGLFGYLSGAEISNLNLVDVNIIGNNYVSGLTGYANFSTKSTLISNVTVSGNVTGITRVGGLVGYLKNSTLYGVHNSANVESILATGPCYIGGVAGVTASPTAGIGGKIINSSNSGNITGSAQVGGIIGYAYAGANVSNLINLYNDGNIFSREGQAGGIAGGLSYAVLVNAYNKGYVFGYGEEIGGIAAYNYLFSQIYNSYNTGTVTGYGNYTSIGGITGLSRSGVINSFSTGSIVNSNSNTLNSVVGLHATSSGTSINLHWVDKVGDSAVFCNAGTDTNCTLSSEDSNFYSNSHGVYVSSPTWADGNWVWSGTDFPVFAWQ